MIKSIDIGDYHMRFRTEDGFMARWGKTPDDDPVMCPMGPELIDIEISTVCHGIGKSMETRKPCSFCYKSNTGCGENMSLGTFKTIFAKFPPTLTQIAFGVGDIEGNPDLWNILRYCREQNVIPNLTTNGMGLNDELAERLAHDCGAVAVSHYGDDDLCFGAVARLSRAGLKQANIHKLVAQETLDSCHALIDEAATDPDLKGLKSIVFLLMKPKGKRNRLTPVTDLGEFKSLFMHAHNRGVSIGMDSCFAPMALKTLPASTIPSIEPCESGLFSLYVSKDAKAYPCSFAEGTPGWETGIDLLDPEVKGFTSQVWESNRLQNWRERLLESSKGCSGCSVQKHCRSCPVYPEITVCKEKPK